MTLNVYYVEKFLQTDEITEGQRNVGRAMVAVWCVFMKVTGNNFGNCFKFQWILNIFVDFFLYETEILI